MQLTNTKPDFITLSELDQRQFFEQYLSIREKAMTQPIVKPRTKGKKKKGGKQISLTNEQYGLLQKLGLV